jgi:ATP-dependent RNA helicase DDX24/MAK5
MAPRLPPPVSVAAIVGGMSAHKQRRVLERGVDVLVATPGRLWDLLEEVEYARHRRLFVVADESLWLGR